MLGFSGLGFVIFAGISILLLLPALLQIFRYYIKYDALTFHIKTSQVIKQKYTLNFIAEEGIAEYVKQNTAKNDYVLQWGYNHEFYVLAQRMAALSGKLACALMTDPLLNDATIPSWRKHVLSDIKKFAPEFIIDFYGSLNIKKVNEVSGMLYKLDKYFYGIYPLYRLVDTHCSRKKTATEEMLKSLTENNTKRTINSKIFNCNDDFIQFVNRLVMKGSIKKADIYTNDGVTQMFDDWRSINNEKR
ncbi:ABC-type transport system, ATPase and permease components [Candidatus Scalindua japonica]|uniref:ABC-type transport system, ATPase and permease components n=2 Tax=Candidatus Scalindua japonica TaxID=1284222 RepID=A0A286TWW7_9BACT|nr:ABC-type transport system, ATPase and permease components [Candidatus Scalindua japonica]